MTMQAFAIVEGLIQMKRQLGSGHILGPHVMEATNLRFVITIHRVVRMASEAGVVPRHAIVLEVGCWNPGLVVYRQAAPVRLHNVTRQTELRRLRRFHMPFKSGPTSDRRQNKQCNKGSRLPRARPDDSGYRNDHLDENYRNCQEAN